MADSQEIKVLLSEELKIPISIQMGESERRKILEILEAWHDYGFGRSVVQRKRWWHYRQRSYYRVKTQDDKVLEIYQDRGTIFEQAQKEKWYLSRIIT